MVKGVGLENRPIAFIPHSRRLKKHRVDYLKAINDSMDYPYQSEDGRELSMIQQALHNKCVSLSNIPYWTFTDCCTDALQISIHCLTKPGDTIIVPAYGWRAFANAVVFMNRHIQFVDIDDTGNISIEALDMLCKTMHAPAAAVIVVHNFGTIVDCNKVVTILNNNNWSDTIIIEDAAPAFYMGEPYSYIPGSASDVACFSFDFTKYPGTLGSGGAIATRHESIKEKIYIASSHGRSKNTDIVAIGTKSYMDNTSCSVLLKEIELFEENEYRKIRNYNANWLNANLPYKAIPGENYIWERYTMSVPETEVSIVLDKLKSIGCLARTFFKEPLHKFSHFNSKTNCLNTEKFVKNTIMLPCHHYLTKEELTRIANVLS